MPSAQLNHTVYQFVQPQIAQVPPSAQPDMIVAPAPRQQSVIQARTGPQSVEGYPFSIVLSECVKILEDHC